MPTYRVQAPDGRTFRLSGDRPPTEQELEEIFASMGGPQVPEMEQPAWESAVRQANLMPVPGEEEVLGTIANLPKEALRRTGELLPTIGGTVGAFAGGGWGSVPLAALGAGAGEAGRRLISEGILADEPPTGGIEAAADIGADAALAGGGAALGIGAAKAILPAARLATNPAVAGAIGAGAEYKRSGDPVQAAAVGAGAVAGSRKYGPKLIQSIANFILKRAAAAKTPAQATAAVNQALKPLPEDVAAIVRAEVARTAPRAVAPSVAKAETQAAVQAAAPKSVAPAAPRAAEGASELESALKASLSPKAPGLPVKESEQMRRLYADVESGKITSQVKALKAAGKDAHKIARQIQNDYGGPNRITLMEANNLVEQILRMVK